MSQIREQGRQHTTTQAIADGFALFYTGLYRAQPLADHTQIMAYLDNIASPVLEQDERDGLEAKITLTEVEDAINRQKSGKTPGPNGLPAEFFKQNTGLLAPHLLKMFQAARKEGMLR